MFKRFLFFIILLFCLNTHTNAESKSALNTVKEKITEIKNAAVDGMKTVGKAVLVYRGNPNFKRR